MGVRSNATRDPREAMSAQTVPNARTPRIRSCRKRSYVGDNDTSPEISNSASKKAKPPSTATARTVKTPARKSPRNPSSAENAPTPVGVTKGTVVKVPRTVSGARKGRPCTRGGDAAVSLTECQQKTETRVQGLKELRRDDEEFLPNDDCKFEQKDTWPLKYSPNVFGEFVGNRSAVEKVERWLMEWKVASKKTTSRDSDSSSCSYMQQETSSSALFIKGPPGVGKTCLVYYLAKRLGFTVLEVNSSSERPGKRVLADLQEATQSQHVEGTKVAKGGINAFFKPTLTACSIAQTPTPQASSTKSRKKPKNTVVKEKRTTLKNFFSPVTPKTPIEEILVENIEETVLVEEKKPPKSSIKAFFAASKRTSTLQSSEEVRGVSESPEILTQSRADPTQTGDGKIKCSSSTIILFDDVDVIFDDNGDEGFWMALETVLKSSKKPCILTATRGYEGVLKKCRSLQNAPLVELHRPSPSHVASLITSVCAAENRDLTDYNVEFMCQYLASDVRRSLIQMEFETVSSGHLQTVYPANKTMGGLMTSGCTEDAVGIQISFKKVGFNALYASLEDCLPFEFDDILLDARHDDVGDSFAKKRSTKFEAETIKDLSQIFEEFSINDIFTGCLTRLGEECLPSYERAKRWMKQCPMESQDSNQRIVEELLELSSMVLLGATSACSKRITERFTVLDAEQQMEQRLCRVTNGLGFHNMHRELKKVRVSESCLDDVLEHIPIRQRLAFDYLGYLKAICCAENEKREKGRRGNRFCHYLSNIGIFFTPEQLTRIAAFWS